MEHKFSAAGNRWQGLQWQVRHSSRPDYQESVIQLTKEIKRRDGSVKVVIDVDKLKYVFLDPKFKDHLVAVYAIAGPFRSGKSFLQNLLGSYLRRLESGEMDQPSSEEIEVFFKARGGRKPHTEGIHILRKPFMLNIYVSGKQEKVALFLVDTQGLFDLKASIEKITVIGTLSIAISSLQCFNVKERIDRIHLEYIYKFAQKALDMKKKDKESSLIEKESLMFIIRDWCQDEEDTEDEYPYGFGGGRKYFRETLNPADGHAEEHAMMSDYLDKTFGVIPCCLLPYPGEAVRKTVESERDLDAEFRKHLKHMFSQITATEKIRIKKIDGRYATCADLCSRMEAFASMLKQDKSLEDVQSIIQADYEARMNSIATTCTNQFLKKVQQSAESFRKKSKKEVKKKLKSMQDDAIEEYQKIHKPGTKGFLEGWLREYSNLLTQISDGFADCAAVEALYVSLIKKFNDWRKNTASFAKMEDDTFKEEAQKKREELLAKFKKEIALEYFKQCENYFRNDVNKLIAETKAEVKKYLESLETPWWKTALIMGALVVGGAAVAAAAAVAAPAVIVASAATAAGAGGVAGGVAAGGVAAHAAISNHNLKHETNIISTEEVNEQLALTKYEKSEIYVMLCFGSLKIELLSKVKLTQ